MAPYTSTMIATVAISALRYAAAFQPASPVFARRAAAGLRMASDSDFDDFSSKVSEQLSYKTDILFFFLSDQHIINWTTA